MNESIYYVVDEIHSAISNNNKIRFNYFKWNINKEMVPRKEGKYEVSPWALTWDDENYYLIAFDSEAGIIKHYRVDKMRDIDIIEEKREGRSHFEEFDMATYSRMNFGMFGGKEVKVKLKFKKDLVGVLLDRFGKDIAIRSTDDEEWAEANVDVALSEQFLGWIFSLGSSVKIVGPDEVVKRFTEDLGAIEKLYK
jgi:predicted DNA-binding transcriptional regulator YafY